MTVETTPLTAKESQYLATHKHGHLATTIVAGDCRGRDAFRRGLDRSLVDEGPLGTHHAELVALRVGENCP